MASNFSTWSKEYPRHAWTIEKMDDGLFKQSILRQIQLQASLSPKQMALLWERADVLERIGMGEVVVPKVGHRLSAKVTITKAAEVTKDDGGLRYRVSFKAEDGWRGRFDLNPKTTHKLKLIEAIATRANDQATLSGKVVWVRETFVLLEENRVKVVLG